MSSSRPVTGFAVLRPATARMAAGLVLGLALLLAGCATGRRTSSGGPVGLPGGVASVSVSSRNASIVLHRLEPFVRAALREQLGPERRGGARLILVLDEADFPSSDEIEERTDLYGDVLWGSVTLRAASGAPVLSIPHLQGQTLRITLDRLYGVPTDERLASLAQAFARSVAGAISPGG